MSLVRKIDNDGVKGPLKLGEFGLDMYTAGGDEGRVYIGTGAAAAVPRNIALGTKEEIEEAETNALAFAIALG